MVLDYSLLRFSDAVFLFLSFFFLLGYKCSIVWSNVLAAHLCGPVCLSCNGSIFKWRKRRMAKLRSILIACCMVLMISATAFAATEIQWWHAMGGKLGEKVNEIADKFNASQSEYKIVPTYKGNYTETMTAAIAGFRAGKHPHLVQVFEVGTATMMAAKGAVYPVYKLMADMDLPFDTGRFLDGVAAYYTTTDGKMLSMPFNSSTPVVFYNKDAMRKAGLDPSHPPRTWPELAAVSRKMVKAGVVKYGFITGWQSWVQLENFSAWHNVPLGTLENGFGGLGTEFVFNGPAQVKHIQQLADWQKDDVFHYAGRRSDGNPLFINGESAFLMGSSAALAGLKDNCKFELGITMLPYWPDLVKKPRNSIIGGATLWVLAKHKKAEYKGVAEFLNFLSSPEIQADWHQFTGYLPITYAAYELSKKQGYYKTMPDAEVAIKQMTLNPPTPNSKGLRFGNYVQGRDIINEELENVWTGKKTAQQALTDAVERGNALLRKFEKANK